MAAAAAAVVASVLALSVSAGASHAAGFPPPRWPTPGHRPPIQTIQSAIVATRATASGVAMPVGNLPGWKQVFADDFATPAARGAFTRSSYASRWSTYPDGTPDTAGQHGYPSMYAPSKVVSVSGGALDLYLHAEGGRTLGAALSPIFAGRPNGYVGQRYGRYVVRFRSDPVYGYKTAWLLWPDSGVWPSAGEIDFPEGALSSNIAGVMHRLDAVRGTDQSVFPTRTATASGWHTATIEWQPNLLTFALDGKVIGRDTSRIPNTSMHWVLQTESLGGFGPGSRPGLPAGMNTGHLQIDWVTAYARA